MANIIIKKYISLDFLGDEYSKAQLVFRSVPVEDYKQLLESTKGQDDETGLANIELTIATLKKYFVSGTFPDEKGEMQEVENADIGKFDKEVVLHCFNALTGQDSDPKGETPSSTPSTTEPQPQ